MVPKSVDTLSEYGDDVVHLSDRADRRILLAAPVVGTSNGTLGPDESLTSAATRGAWTLQLDASQARSYDVRATLAGLGKDWKPCKVVADGARVPFKYRAGRQVLRFAADVAADGVVRVTACR